MSNQYFQTLSVHKIVSYHTEIDIKSELYDKKLRR